MIMTFLLGLCLHPPPTQPYHSLLRQQMPPCLPSLEPPAEKKIYLPLYTNKRQQNGRSRIRITLPPNFDCRFFHNGDIQTLLIHKGFILLYRRCPLMIPYLQDTKDPLTLAYGMHKAAFSLLTLSRSVGQLIAKTYSDGLNCSGNVSWSQTAFFIYRNL